MCPRNRANRAVTTLSTRERVLLVFWDLTIFKRLHQYSDHSLNYCEIAFSIFHVATRDSLSLSVYSVHCPRTSRRHYTVIYATYVVRLRYHSIVIDDTVCNNSTSTTRSIKIIIIIYLLKLPTLV